MTQPFKAMLLAPSLETGGAERQLVLLANGLARRGHDMHVALFRKTGPLISELDPAVRLHDLGKGGRADLVGFSLRLRGLLLRTGPRVVYSFLTVPNLAAALMKLSGVPAPVAWSVRASDVDPRRYGPLSRVCYRLERMLSGLADGIIVNSEAGAAHCARQGYSRLRMDVVRNGIDTARFVPDRARGRELRRRWFPDGCASLVGLVARLDPMKDHPTFLRAVQKASAMNPGLRFVCVGHGPLEEELKAMSARLGLSKVLVWAGAHSDMPGVYNALDMLCLSSVSEGFPNVLGEAMSCGVPCVTTDAGDAALVVGETGAVAPRRDPEALARTMLAQLERLEREGDGLRWACRARVEANFSVERMVAATEALLGRLVEGKR